ncbi:sigma-54 interaction domain-containing protein [Metabacillus rhizolycopersici]|uniref:HTH-type transcriptional regulatory protein TyrR n=1 Tax=Metabacillus rhizolycopersici TaxID=2875709 RepID=A0ABS7UW41_9BACI|nr:sigma 54-interacting transcriptional regulator [Metabacillus rhizolycopersici]MBZ5752526.1 sigma 54-interacting transcriptional regulator [Metabacillus rhizolycopersici]
MNLKDNAYIILDQILRHSFDEIFIADAKGNILYTRQITESLFGIPHEKIIHQNVFHLEKQGVFSPSVTVNVLKNKTEETLIQETRNKRKLIISGYPIFDERNTMIGAISFSRDITEFEYLKKENEQVAKVIQQYREEIAELKTKATQPFFFKNSKMEKVLDVLSKVASLGITVLLEGESGVGKSRFAHMIHHLSSRRNEPFIEINCGAIAESLIESELFGYEDGAFTGARKGGKKGYFESAGGGTLFLDEIGELPMNLQVKLLSVLQNHSFMRVGGSKRIEMKCRIVCATNQNLEEMIQKKTFREDLYYRINVVNLTIPPLRERREEMIPLIYEITEEFNTKYGMDKHFSPEMIAWLSRQDWPGNVRELRNFIEKAVVTTEAKEIDLEIVEDTTNGEPSKKAQDMTLNEYLESVEKEFFIQMYKKYPSSVKLSKKLGISQSTANRKIRKYVDEL